MPKVTIIVPNFNHAQYLNQRMKSIMNQTFQDFEVILLDDHSSDNSRDIIEQYRNNPKISKIIYNETNSGSAFKQWEKGIQNSSGDYIWIAESDDYCDKEFLKILMDQLERFPEAGIAYCQSFSVDNSNTIIRNWIDHTEDFFPNIWNKSFYMSGEKAIFDVFFHKNVIPNASGAVFSRCANDKTSGIETGMKLNGDWFFWIKLLEKSDLVFVAENLNFFRQHEMKATLVHTKNFNRVTELCKIYKYLIDNKRLTRSQFRQMNIYIINSWFYLLLKNNVLTSIKNLPRICREFHLFSPYFYLFIPSAFFAYLDKKILRKAHKIQINSQFSVKHI